jgi:hypothetical protein
MAVSRQAVQNVTNVTGRGESAMVDRGGLKPSPRGGEGGQPLTAPSPSGGRGGVNTPACARGRGTGSLPPTFFAPGLEPDLLW